MTQRLFVGDTVSLISNPAYIGTVLRANEIVPNPEVHNLSLACGLKRGEGVELEQFNDFYTSGILPKGLCVIMCHSVPTRPSKDSMFLFAESRLSLVDRQFQAVRMVKKSYSESLCGTIINKSQTVNLIPPLPWPNDEIEVTVSDQKSPQRNIRSNYVINMDFEIHGISANDLQIASKCQKGDHAVYKGWVGRITDIEQSTCIRLNKGTVVEIKNRDSIKSKFKLSRELSIGDFVTTTKAVLQKATYLVGKYEASTSTSGFIVDMNVLQIEVEWVFSENPLEQTPPPAKLSHKVLRRNKVRIYNEQGAPANSPASRKSSTPLGLELNIGDCVRFRNLPDAAIKYSTSKDDDKNIKIQGEILRDIAAEQSGGFDRNFFIVSTASTSLTVLWQDLTITKHRGIDLVPAIAFHNQPMILPGRIIMTRRFLPGAWTKGENGEWEAFHGYRPERVGFVQSVNPRAQIANIRWAENPRVGLADKYKDQYVNGSMVFWPGQEFENVSLYDICDIKFFVCQVSDFVNVTVPRHAVGLLRLNPEWFKDLAMLHGLPKDSATWVGQIVEFGTDGLITVRMGAADPVIDVRVPAEYVFPLYSSRGVRPADHDDDGYGGCKCQILDAHEMVLAGLGPEDLSADELRPGQIEDKFSGDKLFIAGDTAQVNDEISRRVKNAKHVYYIPFTFSYTDMFSICTFIEDGKAVHVTEATRKPPYRFAVLGGNTPLDHKFASSSAKISKNTLQRIKAEHQALGSSLPEGVYVRTWEKNLTMMRVLVIGPICTPYEYAPIVIDLSLADFPEKPPQTSYLAWIDLSEQVHPKLYEDGRISLALLDGKKNNPWSPSTTLLEIIVSMVELFQVKEPFYSAEGLEKAIDSDETRIPSLHYSETAYLTTRKFIRYTLESRLKGIKDLIETLYVEINPDRPQLLVRSICKAIELMRRSQAVDQSNAETHGPMLKGAGGSDWQHLTKGAMVTLKREVQTHLLILKERNNDLADALRQMLDSPTCPPPTDIKHMFGALPGEN